MKGQFSESLAGRKQLFELWPLTFDEFLRFKNINVSLPEFTFEKTNQYIIERLSTYYNEYITYGGFPEIVLSNKPENKKSLLLDIFDSYIKLDILFLSDFRKADELYNLVRLLSSRVGSKIDYSKISSITGLNRHKVKDYILFLENTYFIRLISPFVTNPDREIALQKKVYFTDNGLLNILGQISSGASFENCVANQLFDLGKTQYYAKRDGREIDFILNGERAFEVKETPSEQDLKTLKKRALGIGINNYHLIGKKRPASGFCKFIWGGAIN